MRKLVLLRHGETQWNISGRLQGWQDSPLTAKGVKQVVQCQLPKLTNPVIYSSDLGRAMQSADILANRLTKVVEQPINVVALPELRERYFGDLQGKIIANSYACNDYACNDPARDNIDWQAYHCRYQTRLNGRYGIETEYQFEQRIRAGLKIIGDAGNQLTAGVDSNSDVIVVSHGEWIRAVINIANNLPSWRLGKGVQANGSATVLPFDLTKKNILSLYRVSESIDEC